MTATVWRWMLDGFYGLINRLLLDLHLLATPVDWLGNPNIAFALAHVGRGLRVTALHDLRHPGRPPVDPGGGARGGQGRWRIPRRTFRDITLPLLRPALLVATLINMINVFNSFPIIWVMTKGGPGYQTDTTTTFMYKIAFRNQNVGQSAAMAVVNFVIVLVFVRALPAHASTGGRGRDAMTSPMRKALLAGTAYLVAFLFLAPYLEMLLTALKPHDELFRSPTDYLPSVFQWDNFIKVWQEAPVAGYLKSSLIIAGCATLVVLVVSLPAAYYTARNRYRGRTAFLLLVLVTQMFAPTALVIGLYREFVSFGLVNSYLTLIVVNAAFNLAFSIWIMSGYISTIPVELEEAAEIDGCTRLGVLWRVTLPLALPGIVTAVIFTFIAAWNEFVIALTLTNSPDIQPLTVGVTTFVGQYEIQWHYLFAASLIAVVPVVILFAFIERWLVGGLTAGSVK